MNQHRSAILVSESKVDCCTCIYGVVCVCVWVCLDGGINVKR